MNSDLQAVAKVPICGAVFSTYGGGEPIDKTGCVFPNGHDGPHQFIDARNGKKEQWEIDWDCP